MVSPLFSGSKGPGSSPGRVRVHLLMSRDDANLCQSTCPQKKDASEYEALCAECGRVNTIDSKTRLPVEINEFVSTFVVVGVLVNMDSLNKGDTMDGCSLFTCLSTLKVLVKRIFNIPNSSVD